MPNVDVVTVAYNSRDSLRAAVEPLAGLEDIAVYVVDNASPTEDLAVVSDLGVHDVRLPVNRGFAAGCNAGWRAGSADYVLLLNPDARLEPEAVRRLADVLGADPVVAAAAPRIVDAAGGLEHSQRVFPRLRSTFAQSLFLHRVFRGAGWTDELVRDPAAYERAGSPDWVSGACLLLRRSVLERVNGLDESYFHYTEDLDLCRRIRDLGLDIRYEPGAVVVHEGGRSAPRASLLPLLARNRVRYARLHRGRAYALLERLGVALGALTHVFLSRDGDRRRGHARALRYVLSRSREGA